MSRLERTQKKKDERVKYFALRVGYAIGTTAVRGAFAYFILIGLMFTLYGEMRFDMFVSVYYAFIGASLVAMYVGFDEADYEKMVD